MEFGDQHQIIVIDAKAYLRCIDKIENSLSSDSTSKELTSSGGHDGKRYGLQS
jgi:hypothetical protein